MFKKIFLVLILIVGAFMGYAAMQPSEYTVYREVTINASPEKIFPHLDNKQLMHAWNPWVKLDPKAKFSFSGPDSGIGAKTTWEGGDQLGNGSATVVESVPNTSVKTKLEYTKPFEMSQMAEFTLKPAGPQTIVRWSVAGNNTFIGRMLCVFMNMDKMVGDVFERGLSELKRIAETA